MSPNPNPTTENKPKAKICTVLYIFLRLVHFIISKRNWSNTRRFYIQSCSEPIKERVCGKKQITWYLYNLSGFEE
jgi:hypothetical protein